MSLATKYRPKTFSEVIEQNVVKAILQNQINTGNIKNSYLFCGPAGCGKTSDARILAKDINGCESMITELDAASHSGVDDIRKLVEDSRFKPIGCKYRIYVIDECHSLSNTAWQSLLKALEEPVPTSIFIFCTTDPQKIPSTIISRIQRFDFKKISMSGIIERLKFIIESENKECEVGYTYDEDAIEYIAKLSDGGMRDAITLMEKALSFNAHLTVETVSKSLGTVDYGTLFDLTDAILNYDKKTMIEIVENIHSEGNDLKQFIKNYNEFVLDLCKYGILKSFDYIKIPKTYSERFRNFNKDSYDFFPTLLNELINLNSTIKWESTPKPIIESTFILLCSEG